MSENNESVEATYEKCIVTFLDILGFRSMLADKTPSEILSVLRIFNDATNNDDDVFGGFCAIDNISDAIVRARPYSGRGGIGGYTAIFAELQKLAVIQIECIRRGVLIRGGLTSGSVHFGELKRGSAAGPLFGPALATAYELESRSAIYPRIVVESAAYDIIFSKEKVENNERSGFEWEKRAKWFISRDDDGEYFIDYIRHAHGGYSNAGYFGDDSLSTFFRAHKDLIDVGLAIDSEGVRKKYEWLRARHNYYVDLEISRMKESEGARKWTTNRFQKDAVELWEELLV